MKISYLTFYYGFSFTLKKLLNTIMKSPTLKLLQ